MKEQNGKQTERQKADIKADKRQTEDRMKKRDQDSRTKRETEMKTFKLLTNKSLVLQTKCLFFD